MPCAILCTRKSRETSGIPGNYGHIGGAQDGNRSTRTEVGSSNAGVVSEDRGVPEQRDGCKGVV